MENIFPLQESAEIEGIYGSKRQNASPPKNPRTFRMRSAANISTGMKSCYFVKTLDWFDVNNISTIEKISMEDTISLLGEKEYMSSRNKIIDAYIGGRRPITVTAALEVVRIDLASLLRIFGFLEMWKLVNYKTAIRKELINPESNSKEENDIDEGTQQRVADSISLDLKEAMKCSMCECGRDAVFFTKFGVFRCLECFESGSYPLDVFQTDFFKISESLMRNMWSKKEEFLLLEGINMFDDQWKLVSNHVGTKTKTECAFHFLRLPILENNLSMAKFSTRLPFETAENPVMCLIVFICAIVHPVIASECARVAMKCVCSDNQGTIVRNMLEKAKEKGVEQLDLEKRKIQKLENVICEAILNKIKSKIESYRDMHMSIQKIHSELVSLRKDMAGGFALDIVDESFEDGLQ